MVTFNDLQNKISEFKSRVGRFSIGKSDFFGFMTDMVDKQKELADRQAADLLGSVDLSGTPATYPALALGWWKIKTNVASVDGGDLNGIEVKAGGQLVCDGTTFSYVEDPDLAAVQEKVDQNEAVSLNIESSLKLNLFKDPFFYTGIGSASVDYNNKGRISIVQDSPDAVGGNKAIEFQVDTASKSYAFFPAKSLEEISTFGIDEGDTLSFGVWVKTDVAFTSGNIALYYDYAQSIWNGRKVAVDIPVGSWTWIEFNSIAQVGMKELRISCLFEAATAGSIRMTGLTLTKGSKSYAINEKEYYTALDRKNIAFDGISQENVDFLSVGKNLFNKDSVTPDFYFDYNGNPVSLAGWNYSSFIPVLPNTDYTRSFVHNLMCYDKEKRYIAGYSSSDIGATFTTPEGCYYIRVNVNDANLDTYQLEKGTVSTIYESYALSLNEKVKIPAGTEADEITLTKIGDTLSIKNQGVTSEKLASEVQTQINEAGTPDNVSIQKVNGQLSVKKITSSKLENISDQDKIKLANLSNEVLTAIAGGVSITINGDHIYKASDSLHSDGTPNTIAEIQTVIDNIESTGGGVLFFQKGHYVIDADVAGHIQMKNNVHLVGEGPWATILEVRSDAANVHGIRYVGADITAFVMNMELRRSGKGTLIVPDGNNMGLRTNVRADNASKIRFANVEITDSNFNIGYDPAYSGGQGNPVEASAAYMAVDLAGAVDFKAYSSNITSCAWGLFLINSSGGRVVWNGNITSFYKGTGVHGTDAEIIVNGDITSYCSAGTGCVSCSGGRTVVNGRLIRRVDNPTSLAMSAHAIYVGTDDYSEVMINGDIITDAGVVASSDGRIQINGNIHFTGALDAVSASSPTAFGCSGENPGTRCYFNGSFFGNKTAKLLMFRINKAGKMFFNGVLDARCWSLMGDAATTKEPELVINGTIRNAFDDFIRIQRGKLTIHNSLVEGDSAIIKVEAGASKKIKILNSGVVNDESTYDENGNLIKTPGASAYLVDFSSGEGETDLEVMHSSYAAPNGQSLIRASNPVSVKVGNSLGNVALGNNVTNLIANGYISY